ncbi:hypothetical protein [Lysobacter antibioticus]|uniref:hypothetical protein n=1 Tax=Lysobacter antibioticus TaxID=84531 RepID=UPI0003464F53|nr:hypothetical protein [Lysobacter antibioticus]
MDKPSDRAIAQAFWDAKENWDKNDGPYFLNLDYENLLDRAREIDAAAPEGAQGQDVKDLRDMAKHFAERALLCDPKWNPHQVSARYRDLCLRLAATPPQHQDAARDREDAARYRWLRKDPSMLLHLSNRDFDAAIDAARAAGGGGE